MMTTRIRSKVFFIAVIFLILLWTTYFLHPINSDRPIHSDFLMHYTGAKIALQGNIKELFTKDAQYKVQDEIIPFDQEGQILAFRMPPLTALIYSPIALFNFFTAYKVLLIVHTSIALFAVYILKKETNTKREYILFLLVFFYSFFLGIYQNQPSIMIFLIMSELLVYLRKRNWKMLGILSGFLMFKPQYLLLLPFILVITKDRRTYVKSLAVSLCVMIVLNLLLYGTNLFKDYVNFAFESESDEFGTQIATNLTLGSTFALFNPEFRLTNPIYLGTNLILFIVAVLALLYTQKSKLLSVNASYAFAILFAIFLNLHVQAADHIFLFIPIVLLTNELANTKNNTQKALLMALIITLFSSTWLMLFDVDAGIISAGAIVFIFLYFVNLVYAKSGK